MYISESLIFRVYFSQMASLEICARVHRLAGLDLLIEKLPVDQAILLLGEWGRGPDYVATPNIRAGHIKNPRGPVDLTCSIQILLS